MSPPLVQCDWQTSRKRLCERGKYLLETGMWSDCRFLVGSEPLQKIFDGHKLFLAMSSPVFEAMFFGGMPENNPITILDVQPEAFRSLLEYIYTDHINLTSFDQACELCYVAKKYMLPYLVEECTKYLWSDLYPKNACRAYEFAKLFEEPILMEKCLQIITTKTQQVFSESSFDDIELSTLATVFDQDVLQIDSELELYNALIRYVERCSQSTGAKVPRLDGIEIISVSASASTENSNNRSSTIRNILTKIRFLTMTPQQFAEGPATSDLLTQAEKFAILINISSPTTEIPMPTGFSTSRISRTKRLHPIDPSEQNKNLCVDMRKFYCIRSLQENVPYKTTIGLNCEVSFTCDKCIIVCGIEIPSQMHQPNNKDQVHYNELIYAYLSDGDGSRLTYTHCTSRVPFDALIDISFNRPVHIQKNRLYRISVSLSKNGIYPLGLFPTLSTCNGVSFVFGRDCVLENPEGIEKGVVRTIIFKVPETMVGMCT